MKKIQVVDGADLAMKTISRLPKALSRKDLDNKAAFRHLPAKDAAGLLEIDTDQLNELLKGSQ